MNSSGYDFEGYNHGPLQSDKTNSHWLAHGPSDYLDYTMDFGQNEDDAYRSGDYMAFINELADRVDLTASLAALIRREDNTHYHY